MGLSEASGIVLKSVKYGESGRIFTVLTHEFGKISVSASALRKNRAGLAAALSTFSYSRFVMFKSEREGSIYRINECEIIRSFDGICDSLEKVAYASYFADIALRGSNENMRDDGMLRLLLNTLYLLMTGKYSFTKLKTVFEIKAAAVLGYAPNLNECMLCRRRDKLLYFSLNDGTAVCEECAKGALNCVAINDTIIHIINHIISADVKKVFSFTASEEIISYLSTISEMFIEKKLEYRFKTLDYLRDL